MNQNSVESLYSVDCLRRLFGECKTAVCGRVYKTEVCDTVQCNLLKTLNETVDEARFFRKTENCWNKMATKISAKHQWRCQVLWQHGKSIEKKQKQNKFTTYKFHNIPQ